MKLGSIILDLNTGKRGHVVSLPVLSRPIWLQGLWLQIDGRRTYTRNWRHCGQRAKTEIEPKLLELAERVKQQKGK